MSTGCRIDDQYATYFITPTIVDWVDVLSRKCYRDIIIDSLNFCIKEKHLIVYGYVIMTNHLHLIVRSTNGTLSGTIGDFKKFTAKAIIRTIKEQPESRREWMLHKFEFIATTNQRSSDHQLWMHENHPEIVFSEKFFNQKLNYIHNNPVRAGIVEFPEDYLHSSAKSLIKNVPGLVPITPWGF